MKTRIHIEDCTDCDYVVESGSKALVNRYMTNHKVKKHPEPESFAVTCEECHRVFYAPNKGILKQTFINHLETHKQLGEGYCISCSAVTSNTVKHFDETKFLCRNCDYDMRTERDAPGSRVIEPKLETAEKTTEHKLCYICGANCRGNSIKREGGALVCGLCYTWLITRDESSANRQPEQTVNCRGCGDQTFYHGGHYADHWCYKCVKYHNLQRLSDRSDAIGKFKQERNEALDRQRIG